MRAHANGDHAADELGPQADCPHCPNGGAR